MRKDGLQSGWKGKKWLACEISLTLNVLAWRWKTINIFRYGKEMIHIVILGRLLSPQCEGDGNRSRKDQK